MSVDPRFLWMMDVLDIEDTSELLEIGCGGGAAIAAIVPKLTTGSITGVDRSPAMIARASNRNRTFIDLGKVRLIQSDLEDLAEGYRNCNKIFAFNVNLFWTKPDMANVRTVLRSHLRRDGQLYLFYQPPTVKGMQVVEKKVVDNLNRNGFSVADVKREKLVRTVAIISSLR